jgi:hypothetical protein
METQTRWIVGAVAVGAVIAGIAVGLMIAKAQTGN